MNIELKETESGIFKRDTIYSTDLLVISNDTLLITNLSTYIDYKTFAPIDNWQTYFKDSSRVYFQHFSAGKSQLILIPGANPSTFKRIGHSLYAKDDQHVYFGFTELAELNPNFSTIICPSDSLYTTCYIRDNKSIYYETLKVSGIDLRNLKIVKGDEARIMDNKNTYLNGVVEK